MHRQVSPVGLLNRLPAGPAPLPHPVAPPGCPASRPTCPAHRPALQGCLVLSGLRGLAQQLMVSRTTACGEPQELGETEAQRRPQCDGGAREPALWGPFSPRFGCTAWGGWLSRQRARPPEDLAAPSQLRFLGAAQPGPATGLLASSTFPETSASLHPSPPGPVQPPTLSSATGTVCTGMGLQAASGPPGAASENSPARLA